MVFLTLLYAQPLTTICRMRTDQMMGESGRVLVTFDRESVGMPPLVDDRIREQLQARGNSSYAPRSNGWLLGRVPGRPLQIENVRAQLVALGVKPQDC